MKQPIHGVSFHDLHLLHRNVATNDIVTRCKARIQAEHQREPLNLILFPGDVFDRPVAFNDPEVFIVKAFIRWLLLFCKKHDIVLIIVEGTPSHDGKQSMHFVDENKRIEASVYYEQEVTVKYIKELGFHMLFVPDQMGTPDVVYEKAIQALNEAGIKQAELCIHHGQFKHQFPPYMKISCLDSEAWDNLVSHAIFTGHIHTRSQFNKILGAGSFDRLKHGEEEPKGYYRFHLYPSSIQVDWIENEQATIFKTVDVADLPLEDALDKVNQVASSVPDLSFLRIHVGPNDAIGEGLPTLKKTYPLLHIAVEPKPNKVKEKESLEIVEEEFIPIEINPNNLLSLAEKELSEKYPLLSEAERQATLSLLESHLR